MDAPRYNGASINYSTISKSMYNAECSTLNALAKWIGYYDATMAALSYPVYSFLPCTTNVQAPGNPFQMHIRKCSLIYVFCTFL